MNRKPRLQRGHGKSVKTLYNRTAVDFLFTTFRFVYLRPLYGYSVSCQHRFKIFTDLSGEINEMSQERQYTQEQAQMLHEAITEALSHLDHFSHANAQYNPDALSAHAILLNAIDTLNADTPPPAIPAAVSADSVPLAGTCKPRYKVDEFMGWYIVNETEPNPFQGNLFPSVEAAEKAIARLNAASPANGDAATGSSVGDGNGGES